MIWHHFLHIGSMELNTILLWAQSHVPFSKMMSELSLFFWLLPKGVLLVYHHCHAELQLCVHVYFLPQYYNFLPELRENTQCLWLFTTHDFSDMHVKFLCTLCAFIQMLPLQRDFVCKNKTLNLLKCFLNFDVMWNWFCICCLGTYFSFHSFKVDLKL